MTTYFTSDTHFGHARIQEFQPNRPQGSIEEMNEHLVDRWNSTVNPSDTVYFLGDFAMGKIAGSLPYALRLNGTKHLIPGNHDRVHPSYRQRSSEKRAEWVRKYLDVGFVSIANEAHYDLPGYGRVNLCHFPYYGEHVEGREHEYDPWRPFDDGRVILHGHIHSEWMVNGRQINVGVDVWDLAPVSERVLADLAGSI